MSSLELQCIHMKTQKMNANKAISMGILVVNDGLACQNKVSEVLRHCDYEVLHTGTVYDALHSIWENKDKVDLVITDVQKLESDGVTIIQNIKERLKLQVMLIDIDEKTELKGEPLSFSAYFLTGLSLNGLSHLLVNAKQVKEDKMVAATNQQENIQIASVSNDVVAETNKDSFSIEDAARLSQIQKAVELYEETSEDNHNDHYKGKKRRVTWTNEMHQKFLDAIERLGYDKAVPKRIVEVMGVPGLTRENVASHLQKYRWSMRRTKETVFGSHLTGKDLVFGSTMGMEFYTRIRGSHLSDVRNMMQWRNKHCSSSDNSNTSKFVGYRFIGNQIDYGPINRINTVAKFSTTGRLQDQSMNYVQHHPLSDQSTSCILQQSSLLGSSASKNHCQEPDSLSSYALEIESLLQGPPTQQPQQISGDCSVSLLDQLESWGSSANAVHFHDPTTAFSVLHPPIQDFFEQTPSGFFDDIFQQHCSSVTTPPLAEMFQNLDDIFDRNTYDQIDIQEFDDTLFSQDDYTYSNVVTY